MYKKSKQLLDLSRTTRSNTVYFNVFSCYDIIILLVGWVVVAVTANYFVTFEFL